MKCVQTDNGFEFTNRFSNSKRDLTSLFEATAQRLGIRHKLIRPNGKIERSHREDHRRFYESHHFFSLKDFASQLAVHNSRSNNRPMRPLNWLSPRDFLVLFFCPICSTILHRRKFTVRAMAIFSPPPHGAAPYSPVAGSRQKAICGG